MSKKQKVMEALLTSNVALNSEELMWINSHLPNDEGMGQFKKTYAFNHKAEDLFESIGVTEKDAEKVAEAFAKATKNILLKENYYVSNGIESILNDTSDVTNFDAIIVSKLLRDSLDKFTDQTQLPATLAALLKAMTKRKNRENED